jgi:hypothetical protein
MRLYETISLSLAENAQSLANAWCKGEDTIGTKRFIPQYFTVMKDRVGMFYVTNRFDPRVVEYCKQNNITPRESINVL